MNTPINRFIDQMNQQTLERHAWISTAAAKVRQWREEDRANGIVWADENNREGSAAEKAAPCKSQ